VYLALYGPQGLVIFDHPYNADSERLRMFPTWRVAARITSSFGHPADRADRLGACLTGRGLRGMCASILLLR